MAAFFPGQVRQARHVTEKRGTDFEMRTNIKAQPGSQGTLFQGGKPTAQHRWPRGYSPTRMAQVSGALSLGGGGIHVAEDEYSRDVANEHYNPRSQEHTKRLLLEPLARSTVDPAHLTSLSGGIHLRMNAAGKQANETGEAAHYDPATRTINVNPQYWKNPDERARLAHTDATLIHEVGHHADLSDNWAEHTDALNHEFSGNMEAGLRGRLEHNADAAMITHFRNDPRNQRRTGFNAREHTYGGRGADKGLVGYKDPGAETPEDRHQRRVAAKTDNWKRATGEVLSESPLHAGQFDRQLAMF